MNIFDLFIIQPIFNALMLIYSLVPGGDIGITIIIFTIVVRFLLYPLVKKQLHQTKMMRKLQPKLVEIKKNAKGNKQAEAMQMMDLYKRYGVSPFRSIGILLVQLPIFIGLFYAIRIMTMYRDEIGKFTYSFLENIGPIKALIDNPDSINETMLGFINLSQHAISDDGISIVLLCLAVLAAATQYIMSRQTMPQQASKKTFRQVMSEAAEGKQADQSEMNALVMTKMMKFMPVFMFMIMINLPGAIALYYTVSNLIAVAQQAYLLKGDEEELQEIASEATKVTTTPKKSSQTKTREKQAKEANVTRIVAKDSKSNTKRR